MVAWEPGADEVGDFTWPGFGSEVVATSDVIEILNQFAGFEPAPVEFVEDVGAPKRAKRVRLPYDGPRLHELWVTAWVGMDRERSSAELEHACAECGAERWNLYGVERWDSHYDQDLKRQGSIKTDRFPDAGIYVSEADLCGASIFRVKEFPGWVFCTDHVRGVVVEKAFSNVSFLDVGDTF